MKQDLDYLLELMDDESDQTACMAMAELLARRGGVLDNKLRELQETSNPRLRRRIHQLESALRIRSRRRALADGFRNHSIPLLEGLIQLHLLWFDNDQRDALIEDWEQFVSEFRKSAPVSLERIGFFMRRKGFACPARDNIEAEYFCLGTVLEECLGADMILAAITAAAAAANRIRLGIVRIHSDFALADEEGNLLLPADDWKYLPRPNRHFTCQFCDAGMVLKFAAASLFVAAAATDSFRYLYTIGNCLCPPSAGENDLLSSSLPYPYGSAEKPGRRRVPGA